MKKFITATCLISAMTLSGCAQLANFGDLMWTESRHFAVNNTQKVASLLRPRAARAEPVFALYEPAALTEITTPRFSGHEVETGYQMTEYEPTPSAAYAEPEMPDMSYVKLSGGANINDWQTCQQQAGSYIQPRGNGFVVHPNFEYCMRVKGYIPEREAIEFMDGAILP